ncbi:MAG: short chain dehydrogenase [Pseudonocardia sp.]|nr:short chain dehydrogenase [Pseudonocardia sp.]
MRILLVGNTGVIGSAVEARLRERGHAVLGATRTNAERPTDLSDPESIAKAVDQAGEVDAIACAAGHAAYGPVGELSGAQYRDSLGNKALGQIELVLRGLHTLAPAGSFTLITGVLGTYPVRTSSAASAANGAVESFVRAAALEIAPRRINAVSPTILAEASAKAKHLFPGVEPVTASKVANAYVRSIEGAETGQIYQLF